MWYLARKRPDLIGAERQVTANDTWARSVHLIAKSGFSPSQLATFYRLLERHGLGGRG